MEIGDPVEDYYVISTTKPKAYVEEILLRATNHQFGSNKEIMDSIKRYCSVFHLTILGDSAARSAEAQLNNQNNYKRRIVAWFDKKYLGAQVGTLISVFPLDKRYQCIIDPKREGAFERFDRIALRFRPV